MHADTLPLLFSTAASKKVISDLVMAIPGDIVCHVVKKWYAVRTLRLQMFCILLNGAGVGVDEQMVTGIGNAQIVVVIDKKRLANDNGRMDIAELIAAAIIRGARLNASVVQSECVFYMGLQQFG